MAVTRKPSTSDLVENILLLAELDTYDSVITEFLASHPKGEENTAHTAWVLLERIRNSARNRIAECDRSGGA